MNTMVQVKGRRSKRFFWIRKGEFNQKTIRFNDYMAIESHKIHSMWFYVLDNTLWFNRHRDPFVISINRNKGD